MVIQEYVQLLKALPIASLEEFVKNYYSCVYNSDYSVIQRTDIPHIYLIRLTRKGKNYNRCIAIIDTQEVLVSFSAEILSRIELESNTKPEYRKVDCFCLFDINDKNDYIETADFEHNLTLYISDTLTIGKEIENNKSLRDFLTPELESNNSITPAKFNSKDKILYELFTTGKKIADIKESFIGSYLKYYLFVGGTQTPLELQNNLKQALPNLSSQAFDETIRKSINDDLIHYSNGKLDLSDNCREQLREMQALTAATEKRLVTQFEDCLKKYGIVDLANVIFDNILELYKLNNTQELANLNQNDPAGYSTEKRLVNKLFETLTRRGIVNSTAPTIIQEVLDIVGDSEYLSKMSTTTLFTSLFNSNSLEDYLGTQKRVVFIDSQVLFQLMCVDYQYVPYEDPLYEAGLILYNQLQDSKDYIELYTTNGYVREISNHLYEAHNLRKFIDLDYIKELGPSKNVFYNFYMYLDENEDIGFDGYDDYLQQLLNTDDTFPNGYYEFVSVVDSLVREILEGMNIFVKFIDPSCDMTPFRREYDILLGAHPKRSNARDNDVICMHYLSESSNFIQDETGLADEPFLITMDSTLVPFRSKLVKKFHRSYCYIYPPTKFANRLSIMNMKLDSRKINYNIICLAESNFESSNETISMLDVMSMFFKGNGLANKKLPRLLAKMKRDERDNIETKEFATKYNNNLPIDVALNNIHRHYRKLGWPQFEKVSRLFEVDELSNTLYNMLKENCEYIIKYSKEDMSLYSKIDELIEKNIQD